MSESKLTLIIGSDYYIQDENIETVLLTATFMDWLDEKRTIGIFSSGGVCQKVNIDRIVKKVIGT